MTSRTTRALFIIVALAAALPAHADTRKAKKHYERGMAAYLIEQYDEAIRAFEEGFKEKPLPQFIFNIALAHEKAHRYEEAAKYYQKFLDSWPESKDRPDAERRLASVRSAMSAPAAAPDAGTPPPPPSETATSDAGPSLRATREGSPEGIGGAHPAAPPVLAPVPAPDSGPLTPSFMTDEPAPPPAAQPPRRLWPIWVGVAAGVLAVGLGVGLGVGLTQSGTNVLGAESLR